MRNLRQLLSYLAGELAQSHSETFFAQLCEAIGAHLKADGVMVAEWHLHNGQRRARTLGLWYRGKQLDQISYPLAGTPCDENRPGQICVYRHGVRTQFPDVPQIRRLDIHSYIGVGFADSSGRTIGHIAVFDSKTRLFPADEMDAIRIAAVRAGAELHRICYERSLRESEQALAHSERSLRTLLEHSPVPMVVCNSAGKVEIVNDKFQAAYGYSQSEMSLLENWWPTAFPDAPTRSHIREAWQRLLSQPAPSAAEARSLEAEMSCRGGEKRFVQIKSVHIGDRVATTFLDLTQQHRALHAAEVARNQAEHANRAKDQFLAALSHELRTPLTPVLLASSQLQMRKNLPSDVREEVAVIRRNVEMEARLIDDLLDLARVTNGKLEIHLKPTNIHDAINAAVQICSADIAARQLQIIQQLDAPQALVRGDAARLQQVFWNLVKNAVKFTAPGGTITIRTLNRNNQVLAEVIDDGVGMSREVISGLFTAFSQGSREITRQFGGLGLGLSITRAIVEAHRGVIEADSPGLGRGSTFTVALNTCPVQPPVNPLPHQSPQPSAATEAARILLVEDHQSTGMMLKNILERFGHEIVWAQTCGEARSVLAADNGFDLLVSDLGLPDGSGLELMPTFHNRTGKSGIALSGFGMDQDIAQTRRAGFSAHLIKPVDIHRLRDTIQKVAVRSQECCGASIST